MTTLTKITFLTSLLAVFILCNSTSNGDTITKSSEDSDETMMLSSDIANNEFDDSLVGTFMIPNPEKRKDNPYQAIFSSQNYGTFYQVYCKPILAKNDNNILEALKFKIVNYRGPLNIGFSETSKYKTSGKFNPDNGNLAIQLVVKANSNESDFTLPVRKENIKNGKLNNLNVYRILLKMNPDDLSTNSIGVFDYEYYDRSGNFRIKKKKVPGHEDYEMIPDTQTVVDLDFLASDEFQILGAGLNCYSAQNIAMWE